MLLPLLLSLGLAAPAAAQTGITLRAISPGFIYNAGLIDLAAGFTAQTGIKTTAHPEGMTQMVPDAENGNPSADLVFLPNNLMDKLEADKAIVPGSRIAIGRVNIGLAIHKGDPIPDISTVDKLAAVLKAADSVMYSNPKGGSMEAGIIDNMLNSRPELAGIKRKISTNGEGGQAVARGDGQMALQLICEIINHPDALSNAGPLPEELHAWIDGSAAVLARSTHPKEAAQFLKYITQPGTYSLWLGKGLVRAND
ncbi:MAG TPA: substrate-binding domain-containing protein [Rhizomicrobium sp.]|jgi:molybdate transport system substrate-binding protein|nr:substrate-binding domain-containing protein [Rhizomicrobium sp.]